MIVKTVRDREKGQDGKLKNEKNGWLGGPSVFCVYDESAYSIGNILLHLIGALLSTFEIQSILQGSLCNGFQCFFCEKSLMGCDHDIGEGQKPCGGRMLQNLIGTILEDVFRLFFIDIQTDPGELVQADALDNILGLDQSAPGSVYQNDAILHFLDGVKLDQVVGGIHQRSVKGDQITLRQ